MARKLLQRGTGPGCQPGSETEVPESGTHLLFITNDCRQLPPAAHVWIPADACPGDGTSYLALASPPRYLGGDGDDPIIAESARKHGVSDEDILHAYANPIRVFDLGEGFTMVIGANLAAIIYEIGVVDGVTASVIVHAMRAREKFLR